MLVLETRLLLLETVNLVAVGISLGHLRQVEQAKQTGQNDQNDGVADRTKRSSLRAKADRVLIAARKAGAIHSQRAGVRHIFIFVLG